MEEEGTHQNIASEIQQNNFWLLHRKGRGRRGGEEAVTKVICNKGLDFNSSLCARVQFFFFFGGGVLWQKGDRGPK